MSNVLNNFLSVHLPITGVAAYSIQHAESVLASQCFSKSLYASMTEHLLFGVALTGRTLLPADDRPARYCWVFENLHVYLAARADGVSLALLVEDTPNTQLQRVYETLEAFFQLQEL